MSFFGRKRDKVTAFAISDGTSGHAVSKMADQIRVRWSGLRRIAIILCRPVVPMGVRNLSCMLWTVEKAECRALALRWLAILPQLLSAFDEHAEVLADQPPRGNPRSVR
jgi:hypothetical protein